MVLPRYKNVMDVCYNGYFKRFVLKHYSTNLTLMQFMHNENNTIQIKINNECDSLSADVDVSKVKSKLKLFELLTETFNFHVPMVSNVDGESYDINFEFYKFGEDVNLLKIFRDKFDIILEIEFSNSEFTNFSRQFIKWCDSKKESGSR